MRVHELAKTLNLSSKEVIEKLEELGIKAKSHMSNLDEKAMELLKKGKAPAKKVTEKKVSVTPAPTVKESKKKPEAKVEQKSEPVESPAVSTAIIEAIRVEIPITVGALANKLNLRVAELIKALMAIGIFANVNQLLSEEIIHKLSTHLGTPIEKIAPLEERRIGEGPLKAGEEKHLKPRSPVVTFMGHVDHGKTSLLDAIRKSNIAAKEAGQITQHIGAYGVDLPGKGHVTFLDTPGHAAFTKMRARGANATDVVVLVVGADDGVMPQTIEAIDHAREAGVPIVVAINKCDLPHANPQKVMMQLQKIDLIAEEWGGKTIFCKVSAKTGEGLDNLLDMLLLESEVLELKANPVCPAEGVVIESKLTKGTGPVATVIVQKGTLRIGDVAVTGAFFGKVRSMRNDRGKSVKEAGPSYAVEVHGISGIPNAGEILRVVGDEKTARKITESRLIGIRERESRGGPKHLSLENLHQRIQEGMSKELKLIIKADVQGSVEALAQSLEKLTNDKVRLHVIHGGVGGINETDVMLAAASDAVILGFHVKAEPRAQQVGEEEGVDIRYYTIIYEAVEHVRKAMEGLLEPIFHEVVDGRAEVKKVFRSSKAGAVGGGIVAKGKIMRANKVRLVRKQVVVFDGKLASLRRFKDDVREVAEGYEFGFALEGGGDIQESDILESYRLEKGESPRLK
ncbi:MAG: translation initiation factor IF-2 [Candidatus Omnitrophica bacterium]|nr:translation initiation factor IF-2 [Candidatus Omnitrophota bacterium]